MCFPPVLQHYPEDPRGRSCSRSFSAVSESTRSEARRNCSVRHCAQGSRSVIFYANNRFKNRMVCMVPDLTTEGEAPVLKIKNHIGRSPSMEASGLTPCSSCIIPRQEDNVHARLIFLINEESKKRGLAHRFNAEKPAKLRFFTSRFFSYSTVKLYHRCTQMT